MRTGAGLSIAVGVLAAGCMSWSGGDASVGAPQGTVAATVRLVGGPAPGNRPLAGEPIEVLSNRHVVARIETDEQGRFRLSVAPGRYRFRLKGGPGLMPLTGALVMAAHTTRLHLILNAK
jgi:hypothetical protein